jgi:hypothetical protein
VTGPEHYREAERLLAGRMVPADPGMGGLTSAPPTDRELAAAQVHATLALAAATALNDAEVGMSHEDYRAWKQAVSVTTRQDGGES